jgi:phenylacetate-CoA ligase
VLVLTTLTKQALPLVRRSVRPHEHGSDEASRCRRSSNARMSLIKGRTDDMLIIRGVNIYPSQIEALVPRVSGLTPNYLLVVRREGTLDALEVQVEGGGDGAGAQLERLT